MYIFLKNLTLYFLYISKIRSFNTAIQQKLFTYLSISVFGILLYLKFFNWVSNIFFFYFF